MKPMAKPWFARLRPEDLAEIQLQASQARFLAALPMAGEDPAERAAICAQPVAWSAWVDGRLIACFGIYETFPGAHGVAWALLADGIGTAHLALTRFIQGEIAARDLPRLELLAAAPDVETQIAAGTPMGLRYKAAGHVSLAWRQATPEMRWAVLLGMEPVHLLRQFGPEGESVMLFERIRPRAAACVEAA